MKKIETLVDDIYGLFNSGPLEISETEAKDFGHELATMLSGRLSETRGKPTLRLSNLGKPPRQLWYSINRPELAEALPPATRFKFLFGDIAEALVLFLAKKAGHTVTDEQKKVSINGVDGHIDAKIDGEVADVKSASPYSFKRFSEGLTSANDSFGYLTQLGTYTVAEGQTTGHFVAVEKVLGKLAVDTHHFENGKQELERFIDQRRAMLSNPEPPARCYSDEPDGKSGNRKLHVVCSYCPFKRACWPNHRTFIYSTGPTYLTVVNRVPNVPEV